MEAAAAASSAANDVVKVQTKLNARIAALEEEVAAAAKRAKEAEARADALAADVAREIDDAAGVGAGAEKKAKKATTRKKKAKAAAAAKNAAPAAAAAGGALPALSKMKKAELASELAGMGLSTEGVVVELRQRLREARDAAK